MRSSLRDGVRAVDAALATAVLRLHEQKGVLLSFLFHSLFLDEEEIASGTLDPQQGITVEMLRTVIRHFKQQCYTFVSPDDIIGGLDPAGKYVLLTFDDGYYNNVRALPVLEGFHVPAVFFVSISNVKDRKSFWWDVVYRGLRQSGAGPRQIARAQADYKRFTTADVEVQLQAQFGRNALTPQSDLDRPFEISELREFARHPLVAVGNHTEDHAILTNYHPTRVRRQIEGGQDGINEITGRVPNIISYPNGNCSGSIVGAAREAGLRLGVSTTAGKNYLPLTPAAKMRLKRVTIWGNADIEMQCRVARCDVSLFRLVGSFKTRRSLAVSPSTVNH